MDGAVDARMAHGLWADHVSGFPNEMDWRIMGALGASLNDPNLIAASPAQKARFWPGGDSEDSRVQMFDGVFTLPRWATASRASAGSSPTSRATA